MKKLLSLFVLLVLANHLFSQSPQSFSYQAVVRDNLGAVIENQAVSLKIDILQSSSSGTSVYSETHSVTTNQFGLVNILIGSGSVLSGTFSSINWGADIYFIKIELDPTGGSTYQLMGVSQLLSVPYALYSQSSADSSLWEKNVNDIYYNAGNVGIGAISPNGKLLVQSNASAGVNDDIFSVLNANGDTVFAVYQEGVRVFVNDLGGTKATGSRGGFAVGGYNPTKAGFTNEYFRVTPDSVRVYIDDDFTLQANGSRGGFAVGGFNPTKGTPSRHYLFVQDDSTRVYVADSLEGFGVENIEAANDQRIMRLTTQNYFIGHESGISITNAEYNSCVGYKSGFGLTSGDMNSFYGYQAGFANSSGYENSFYGFEAGKYNTTGDRNIFIGSLAGHSNSSANYSVFIGFKAGYSNNISNNVFIGNESGRDNTLGFSNTYLGNQTGYLNTNGSYNTIMGFYAGHSMNGGWNNVYIGYGAGLFNVSGSDNVFIGYGTGNNNTGGDNVFIGSSADINGAVSDRLVIDNSGTANPLIFGEFDMDRVGINSGTPSANLHIKQVGTGEEGFAIENDTDTDIWSWEIGTNDLFLYYNGTQVGYWNDLDGAYTSTSDKRLKKDIVAIDFKVLPNVLKLKPVSYRLNHTDDNSQKTIGFIAQEVLTLFPELVKNREDGYYGLNYDDFGIIAIKAIQEQQEIISSQNEKITHLEDQNNILKNEIEEIKTLLNQAINK